MRKKSLFAILIAFFVVSCSQEVEIPRENNDIKSINVSLAETKLVVGKEASFVVKDDRGATITSLAKVFVGGNPITNGKYTPTKEGDVEVYATYKTFTSTKVKLSVEKATTAPPDNNGEQGSGSKDVTPKDSYTPKVIVHDFTGTWCGWCADAFFIIKELHDKNPKNVISVGVHTGSGPDNDQSFDYEKYNDFGVEVNPTIWFNNKVNEGNLEIFTKEAIKDKKNIGLAINYDLKNDKVTVYVHSKELSNDKKVVVYLVEDKLVADQSNYSNNDKSSLAFQKGDPIKNLEHNNVLRKILTKRTGNAISSDAIKDNMFVATYSLTNKKNKVKEIQNTKIIAFVVDSKGNALNTQIAKVNEFKNFD